MQTLVGKSVWGGIAIGKIHFFRKGEIHIEKKIVENSTEEIERFHAVLLLAKQQLQGLYEKALKCIYTNGRFLFEGESIGY